MRTITATLAKEAGDALYDGLDDPRIIIVTNNGVEMQTISATRLDTGEWVVTLRKIDPAEYQWPPAAPNAKKPDPA